MTFKLVWLWALGVVFGMNLLYALQSKPLNIAASFVVLLSSAAWLLSVRRER